MIKKGKIYFLQERNNIDKKQVLTADNKIVRYIPVRKNDNKYCSFCGGLIVKQWLDCTEYFFICKDCNRECV
jgi:hypothetical protein